MKKIIPGLIVGLFFSIVLPSTAFAAINITDVTHNGDSVVYVDPGESFTVDVTADLTQWSKWKGTDWGIDKSGTSTPYCYNNKNEKDRTKRGNGHDNDSYDENGYDNEGYDKNGFDRNGYDKEGFDHYGKDKKGHSRNDGDRHDRDGYYTQQITVTAPAEPGSYHLNVIGDGKNKCGDPQGPLFSKQYFVRVGSDTSAPVINPHSDVVVEIPSGTGTTVNYDLPTATDDYDPTVAVSCTPPPGSFFPIGYTDVTCTAQDSVGNEATPVTFEVLVLIPDSTPPVIDSHEDIVATTTDSAGVAVNYIIPSATDDVTGSVAVECTPPPGDVFPIGDTTVTCSAQDTAGNEAQSTFTVTVTFVSTPFTMASQPDESTFCNPDWNACYTDGAGQATIDLGQGSDFGHGTIQSVTIARDDSYGEILRDYPWIIELRCYTDSSYTTTCPDWVAPNAHNGNQTYLMSEFATSSPALKYWTAYFTDPTHESEFGGGFPVAFNPDDYYRLVIKDDLAPLGAYGSATEPYWVLTGMTLP